MSASVNTSSNYPGKRVYQAETRPPKSCSLLRTIKNTALFFLALGPNLVTAASATFSQAPKALESSRVSYPFVNAFHCPTDGSVRHPRNRRYLVRYWSKNMLIKELEHSPEISKLLAGVKITVTRGQIEKGSDAFVSVENAIPEIYISDRIPFGKALVTAIFELSNAKHAKKFHQIYKSFDLASVNKEDQETEKNGFSKLINTYALKMERAEYDAQETSSSLLERIVGIAPFSSYPQLKAWLENRVSQTFENYLKTQERTGHTDAYRWILLNRVRPAWSY